MKYGKNNYPTEPLTQSLADNLIAKYEGDINCPRSSASDPTLQAPAPVPQGTDEEKSVVALAPETHKPQTEVTQLTDI